jgi:hypothetical protein
MKSIALMVCALVALVACGDAQEFADEIGTDEQELIVQVSSTNEADCVMTTGATYESSPFGGLTFGAQTCSSGTTIYVPQTRSATLKVSNSSGYCTAAQFTTLTNTVDNVIAELNTAASLGGVGGWSFSRTSTGTHTVKCEAIPTSTFGNQHIRSYSRAKPDFGGDDISYGDSVYDGSGVAGWNFLTIQIDVPDIQAKGSTAIADDRILTHAVQAGITKLTGTGEFAGNRMAASDHHVSEAAGRVMFSVGERCRARNFSTTDPLLIYWSKSASCPNN